MSRPLRLLTALATAMLLAAAAAGPASADHAQVSVFQDDVHLIGADTSAVERNLALLHGLGAEQIRVNVEWYTLAPDPLSYQRPANFVATNPNDYPAGAWAPYDRLVQLAAAYGMKVEFNLTAPGPLWAMGHHPPTTRAANHWYPNPREFFDFVYAVGTRYSGLPGEQPHVDTWSVWNEPNQPGWLAPQWAKVKHRWTRVAPRLYRQLVNYAWYGLYLSGHIGSDTVLIGETAPEGYEQPGFYTAMTPLPFLRQVYCVDGRDRPLRGTAAQTAGCPTKGPVANFVNSNPLLFSATGFAHHPYYFFHAPWYGGGDPNFVPLARIGRLERFLDGTFRTYGVHRRIPLYFTEYGYQTNPPDPYQVVTPDEQAAYLNEADYMAWRNPRVRSVAQFLLYDAAPNPLYKPGQFGYWDTFQTGVLFPGGRPKPAYYSYRMPIWIPNPRARPGQLLFVWGQVRPADQMAPQRVVVEWRPATRGRYRQIGLARTGADTGYLTARVRLPGSGYVKLAWRSPSGTVLHSRPVGVTLQP